MPSSPSPARPRSRAPLWRAVAVLRRRSGSPCSPPCHLSAPPRPRPRGGTQIVLETQDSERVARRRASPPTARSRCCAAGSTRSGSPSRPWPASGERRIIVELPGVQDPREAAAGHRPDRAARLPRRPRPAASPARRRPDGERRCRDEDGQRDPASGRRSSTGNGVKDAAAEPTRRTASGSGSVSVDFNGQGGPAVARARRPAPAPRRSGDQRVAIVLDDEVISSPGGRSRSCASGSAAAATQITGQLHRSARPNDLAILIKGGALPVPVEVIEQRTVGADARATRRSTPVARGRRSSASR